MGEGQWEWRFISHYILIAFLPLLRILLPSLPFNFMFSFSFGKKQIKTDKENYHSNSQKYPNQNKTSTHKRHRFIYCQATPGRSVGPGVCLMDLGSLHWRDLIPPPHFLAGVSRKWLLGQGGSSCPLLLPAVCLV